MYMNSTTHCSKMELSGYTNDRFSTTERSFQHNEQLFEDNERNDSLTERTIDLKQQTKQSIQHNEQLFQTNERNDGFNTMNDRFKTTNRTIIYTKEWNGTIILTQQNRTIVSAQWEGMK